MNARAFPADGAPVNAEALYQFLTCLSEAVRLRIDGNTMAAEITQLGASAAAADVFPPGTPESAALGWILAAAMRVPEATP